LSLLQLIRAARRELSPDAPPPVPRTVREVLDRAEAELGLPADGDLADVDRARRILGAGGATPPTIYAILITPSGALPNMAVELQQLMHAAERAGAEKCGIAVEEQVGDPLPPDEYANQFRERITVDA
jgi:hypothetical protein